MQLADPRLINTTSAAPPRPGVREVRDLIYRGRARYPRHCHTYSSLFVILGGCVLENEGRSGVECRAGSIGFIPAGVEHASEFGDQPAHGLTIVLDEAWLAETDEIPLARRELGYAAGARVGAAALRLHAACRANDPAGRLATEELIVGLVGEATGGVVGARRDRADARSSRWLETIGAVLRERCVAPPSLAELAAGTGRNASHAARAFRATMGCTMTEYVHLARIARACVMLRSTDREIARVALDAGYFDQPHFARTFKRVMGVSPGRYRAAFGRGRSLL